MGGSHTLTDVTFISAEIWAAFLEVNVLSGTVLVTRVLECVCVLSRW